MGLETSYLCVEIFFPPTFLVCSLVRTVHSAASTLHFPKNLHGVPIPSCLFSGLPDLLLARSFLQAGFVYKLFNQR